MNINARFAEFGMTGAFFWIAQLFYLALARDSETQQALQGFFDQISAVTTVMPRIFEDVGSSLLTAIGLIGIFVTGLALNLLGSYFVVLENRIFARHLQQNRDWMDAMMEGCAGPASEDYRQVRDEFDTSLLSFGIRTSLRRMRLSNPCKHVQAFLFSFVHVFGNNGLPESLKDQVHLWRTARAIGATFFFLGFEIAYLEFVGPAKWQAVLALGFFAVGCYFTLRAYQRMCYTLFTTSCATYSRQQHE